MKNNWYYIAVFFATLCIGLFIWHEISFNRLRTGLEDCLNSTPQIEEVYVHDTVTVEKPEIHWKTRTEYDTVTTSDTVWYDSVVVINNYIDHPVDSFQTSSTISDSNIDATISIQGRGVVDRTFIDSISLDYIFKQEVIHKRKCNWWRKFWCGCD